MTVFKYPTSQNCRPPPPPLPLHNPLRFCALSRRLLPPRITKAAPPSFVLLALQVSRYWGRVYLYYHHDEMSKVDDENLDEDGKVFKRSLTLVNCSMFASVAGLVEQLPCN